MTVAVELAETLGTTEALADEVLTGLRSTWMAVKLRAVRLRGTRADLLQVHAVCRLSWAVRKRRAPG